MGPLGGRAWWERARSCVKGLRLVLPRGLDLREVDSLFPQGAR